MNRIPKKLALAAIVGLVAGILLLTAVRMALYKESAVHFHANFALYIDGQRDPFSSFTFYEEIQSCSSDAIDNPKVRVHLHDNNSHLIHVHDNAVTWGHFFANLGYELTNSSVKAGERIYMEGTDQDLTFMLNGQEVPQIVNRVIRSEDVLLVSYGDGRDKSTLMSQYDSIERDAKQANSLSDPAACSGSKPLTFRERLKKAFTL